MKKLLLLVVVFLVTLPCVATAGEFALVRNDDELQKAPGYWRQKAPWAPSLGVGASFSFRPNYFAPSNADNVQPYISWGFSVRMGYSLRQLGVRGYWSDLRASASWGFSQPLTDNIPDAQWVRRALPRDVGIGLGKRLFVEKNTGISLSFGMGFKIPSSLRSWQRTVITSVSPRVSLGKSFFNGRMSLSYSFGTNFNFYQQSTGKYNPDLAGIPGVNQRWGMSHSIGAGISILRGLSLSFGLSFGVGYSFADLYSAPDGPQVFGSENLTEADLASYAINEGNFYSIFFGLSYSIIPRFLNISVGYSNGGRQFEFQFDANGNRIWTVRNPFKLQNGSFSLSISGGV